MSEPVYTSETPQQPETPSTGVGQTAKVFLGDKELVDIGKVEQSSSWEELFKDEDPAKVRQALADSRRWEQRAKENKAAADRLKEIEDRDLSELQRAQRDREELATRLASIEQDALRYRVASQFSISKEDADEWLMGADEEAVTRKAQRFLELRGQAAPTSPRPDPGQGPRPTSPEAEADHAYLQFFPDEARKK